MSASKLLVGILLSVLIAPVAFAQESHSQEPSAKAQTEQLSSAKAQTEQLRSENEQTARKPSNNCPAAFYELSIPTASKHCRIFGVKKPSTMSFFVVATPEEVVKNFTKQLEDASENRYGEFYSIVSNNRGYSLYVFKDGQGTQVNIRAK